MLISRIFLQKPLLVFFLLTSVILDSHVDGNTTLGENLADHGGLSMALAAYQKWRTKNKDHRLPALPFNDMQLFFIGWNLK